MTDTQGRPLGLIDLTLEVEEGQIFGLVGPNGSGKTTTLKLLLGLVFPTSGSGEVLNQPLGDPGYKEPTTHAVCSSASGWPRP